MKVKKIDLDFATQKINEVFARNDYPCRLVLEWIEQRPRAVLYDLEGKQIKEISIRMSKPQLFHWLWGYHDALCLGIDGPSIA